MSLFSRIFRRDGSEGEDPEGEPKEGSEPSGEPARPETASSKLGPDSKVATASASARDEPTEKVRTVRLDEVAHAAPAPAEQARPTDAKAPEKAVRPGEPPLLPAASALLRQGTPATGIASAAAKQPSGPKPLPMPSGADAAARPAGGMPAPSLSLGIDKKAPAKRTATGAGTGAGTGGSPGDASRPMTSPLAKPGAVTATSALNASLALHGAKPVAKAPVTAATATAAATAASAATATTATSEANRPQAKPLDNSPATAAVQADAPSPKVTHVQSEPTKITREELHKLAAHKVIFLVDFMLELRWGTATSRWAASCIAPLRALAPLVRRLEDASSDGALEQLITVLERSSEAGTPDISESLRAELLQAYSLLGATCGLGTDLEVERGRRDPLIVDELLLQTEGVHWVCIDKVYAAGFCTTERFSLTTADELARLSGITRDVAEGIIASFRAFSEAFPTTAPDPKQLLEKRRLSVLIEELRVQEQRFERASAGWSDEDLMMRRALRVERARTLHNVQAILARLGEVERIRALERLPYAGKLDELSAFLRSDDRAAA